MNQPKYLLGDRLKDTNLTVCGFLKLSSYEYRYYLQIGKSDNTLVVNESDIEIPPDEIVRNSDRNFNN
ncbi:MAG: hypothetical protein RLZZ574_2662 [Cyanobacteriota bacterium]|jgi:hypothetical protein